MKKIYVSSIAILFCIALVNIAHTQSNVTTTTGGTANQLPKFTSSGNIENSQIFDNGINVGIGTTTPTNAKLEISATAITGSMENLFRATVNDAAGDFFELRNSTNLNGQFIPALWGHHETNTRQALHLIGEITAGSDVGTSPVMIFDARRQGAAVQTRPLFSWESSNIPRMTMLANGNVGIGTISSQKRLHIKSDNSCAASMRLESELLGPINGCGPSHSTWDLNAQGNDIFTITNPSLPQPVMTFLGNGNVGIGTTTPAMKLHVVGDGTNAATFTSGSVGIGTSNPTEKLHVFGKGLFEDGNGNGVTIGFNSVNSFIDSKGTGALLINFHNNKEVVIGDLAATTPAKLFTNGGITSATNYTTDCNYNTKIIVNRDKTKALSVINSGAENFLVFGNGFVFARRFEVATGAFSCPDYVFEKEYPLLSISELSEFIDKNKHHPNFLSAKQYEKNGKYDLLEMDMNLLKTGEELSLYVIELKKMLDEQNKVIDGMKKEITELKKK